LQRAFACMLRAAGIFIKQALAVIQ
jgi:hypothetical protein